MTDWEERKIHLTFSPKELRALADKMEKRFPQLGLGDNTCVEARQIKPGLMVLIHLDQTAFNVIATKRGSRDE